MPIHNLCIGTYIPNTTHLIFSLQDLIYYIIFPIACLHTTYINCYIASSIPKNVYLQFYLPNIDTLHNLIYLYTFIQRIFHYHPAIPPPRIDPVA